MVGEGHAVLDLFAGSGVGVAVANLGAKEYGVEKMPEAIKTRELNGMETIYEDVWDIHKASRYWFDTIWASPPCQTFSMAGSGAGRKALDDVLGTVESGIWVSMPELRTWAKSLGDERIGLVVSPLAYVYHYSPMYVAFEQVPPALPVWEALAVQMQTMGYSVWTGYLHSEQYGVPQTRKRAYLLAKLDLTWQACRPATISDRRTMAHIRADQSGLISNYSGSAASCIRIPGNKKPRGYRTIDNFAFTSTSKVLNQKWFPSMENVTMREAKEMMTYPPDFTFSPKNSALQLGNAVPPLLAKTVLTHLWSADGH